MKIFSEKERQHFLGRRALIKWSLFTGAALGLPRWKVFEALGVAGGTALADDASCVASNRSVHVIAGVGSFAWFHLLWPHNDIAAARDDNQAWHAIGMESMAVGTDRPLTLGPQTPWKSATGRRQVTALMAGRNTGNHAIPPNTNTMLDMNVSCFGACAAIQTATPSIVPVIAVGSEANVPFSAAPGSPRIARVGTADDIVNLFNSAASRAGGLLSNQENAQLYSTAYRAFAQLNASAGRPTTRSGFEAALSAANLLGQNLADQLRPTDDDFMRYGVAGARDVVRDFGKNLIITAKAFRRGLTNMVMFETLRDDPHGAFADMTALTADVTALGRSLDAFMEDLDAVDDPGCAGSSLWDNTVMSFHGELPKDPNVRAAWPDSSPSDCNWTYVVGAGHLKTGWFGGVSRSGAVSGWNPLTGVDVPGQATTVTAEPAAAAITYAVSRGDIRRTTDFYRGADFRGVRADETT